MLQTQDGVLKSADKVLVRMAELAALSTDVTKSDDDRDLYQSEVDSLKQQLHAILGEKFNGVTLFAGTNTTDGSVGTHGSLSVVISQDGTQSVGISQLNLGYLSTTNGVGAMASPGTTGGIQVGTASEATAAIATLNTAIQNLATLRATNGSQQVRLTFATDMLAINRNNLEAANSRILDVDVASESANLAKQNILQQAGTSMLAQANMSSQSVLRLLV
jgi:flagellin